MTDNFALQPEQDTSKLLKLDADRSGKGKCVQRMSYRSAALARSNEKYASTQSLSSLLKVMRRHRPL